MTEIFKSKAIAIGSPTAVNDILSSVTGFLAFMKTLKFKNIAYNFLRNTVYKVEVNNDKLYNNVFRAIRYDDVLMDKFGVTNTSSVQLFDTKEQTVVFSDPNKNVPIAILVIFPLFAKGMEIFKKVKSLGRHFNGKG